MTTWTLGNTVSWVLEVRDSAGTLADLGGGDPTATVTRPDSTTATATVTKTSTGIYRADITSTLAGRYRVTWTGTGTNSGALPYVDTADVWAADPRLIISIADARAALNVATTSRVGDDEIRLYIAAATQIIEDLIGPVLGGTVTETRTGGAPVLALTAIPASVTSVTEDGVALTEGDGFCWDEAGLLWRGAHPWAARWSSKARSIVVTYRAGGTSVPAGVTVAARELVQHLVTSGQQSWRPPFAGDAVAFTPSGFAVPNRVVDLLRPFMFAPVAGFA